MRPAQTFQTNQLTTYETGDLPAVTLSHWGQASLRKQSECGRHGLSNSPTVGLFLPRGYTDMRFFNARVTGAHAIL